MANAWLVSAIGTLNGEDYVNGFAVSANANVLADPLSVASGTDVVEAIAPLFEADTTAASPDRGMNDRLSEGLLIARYRVADLRAGGNNPIEISRPAQGGDLSEVGPNQIAAVASIISDSGGRSGRGRFYLGGVTEGDMSDLGGGASLLLDAYVQDLADAVADMQSRLQALIPIRGLGVFSRTDDAFYPAAICRVGNVPKTQRRRQNDLTATTIVNVSL